LGELQKWVEALSRFFRACSTAKASIFLSTAQNAL
jgi:hypothetical protein